MTTPNPLRLALFLAALAAALIGASLAKGGLYIGKHEGDMLHLLQIVFREAQGQWPHLHFQTPIGVLATAPIVFFVRLGAGVGQAMLYAQALMAVVALPAIWWVARSRFQGWTAYAFGALVLVLILALVHGEADRSVSISMHYNRWAWAAAFLAIAPALLPAGKSPRPLADGLVIGAALAAMGLIKATYLAAFLIPVAVGLLGRREMRTLAVALATGLAAALLVTALAGTPLFWLAYLRDLATVAASEVRPRAGLPFGTVIGAPAYMGGSIAVLAGVVFLRQSGRSLEGLVLLLLVPGFFFVTFQNFRNDPQWLWLLPLLILALRPEKPVKVGPGWDGAQAMLLTAVAAGAFALPSILNLAYSPIRHLALETGSYVPILPGSGAHEDLQTPRIRALRVDARIALDAPGEVFEQYHDPKLRKTITDFNGELWPECQVELGTVAWFDTLADDLAASGLVDGQTLFVADVLSSFWLYGAGDPLPGASPWYYGGLPGWETADYLLVPLCPLSTKVRRMILEEVSARVGSGQAEEGTDEAPLTEIRRTAHYVLYEK